MAGLRVFISSTCVDLQNERAQLRTLLSRLGHEPLMSDFSDVLYDHRLHTHSSCIRDASKADVMIVIIGSRFGGTVVPQALGNLDTDAAKSKSSQADILSSAEKISISQAEVIQAVCDGIPVFTFVDARVYAEHHVYQINKGHENSDKIRYPSISKPETAKYIFEFINYITHQISGNSITPYSSFSDIEDHLIKQWSMLFQRLLQEDRDRLKSGLRSEIIFDQIEDLKAAILQSISKEDGREIARSVMKFRRLIDFLSGFKAVSRGINFSEFTGSMDDLMAAVGVVKITELKGRSSIYRTAYVLGDGTYVGSRLPETAIGSLYSDWTDFQNLSKKLKQDILAGVSDASTTMPLTRFIPTPIPNDNWDDSTSEIMYSPSSNVLRHDAVEQDKSAAPPKSPDHDQLK